MNFTHLCLVITDRCPAICDFCGFSCSPNRSQVMTSELILRMIREAKEMGIKRISFSGGEPFLYPELLAQGVREARKEKLGINIATNGFWGAWSDEKMKEILTVVKPDSIGFSYDFFHKKYISEEHIMRAIRLASSLGIRTSMNVADMKGEYSAGRFIQNLGVAKYGIRLGIYPLYRCGRARKMPKEYFLTMYRPDSIGCVYENVLSVFYNGDVYPCCRHEAFESAMKIGNVLDKPLHEVLSESKVPMICDVLRKSDRFWNLLDYAKKKGIKIEDYVGCSCDYCRMIFGSEENMQQMLPRVEELYGEMLVRSLIKGGRSSV